MTLLQISSTGLPLLFLLAFLGGYAPLYTLPGLLPETSASRPGLSGYLLTGLMVALFSLPAHLVLQALRLILPGTVWIAVLGPLLLAALFGAIVRLLVLVFGKRVFGDSGWTGYARMLLASAALALFPALDPVLSMSGFLPSTVFVVGAGCGYTFLLVLLGVVRERMEMAGNPRLVKGTPVLLISAGLIGLACLGLVSLLS
jgi:electron transport complex protein RnfA